MLGFFEVSREAKARQFLEAAGKGPLMPGDPYEMSYETVLKEEVSELCEAMFRHYVNGTVETRADLVKEWADVQVTLSNIAVWFDIPADAAFNRVHNNNMTKVVDGKVRLREDGKILKPDDYVPADMRGL